MGIGRGGAIGDLRQLTFRRASLFQTPKASAHRQARLTPKAPGLLMVAGRAFAEPSGGSCRSVPGTFE
jgi:hypothetical protein